MSKNVYLASKPRYETLDGLRGVAAFIVMCFHLLEASSTDHAHMLTDYIGHGYLAVDFFFILSGFVIGYAYDDRWNRMTLASFFKRRLIRLHPTIVFAILLGLAFFFYGWGAMFPLVQDTDVWSLLLISVMFFFMIPVPESMDIKGWGETTPLNGNAWSLWFEYVANLLYALVIRHFPKWLLAVFVVLCAVLTIDISLDIDMFGFLSERTSHYTIHGGWSLNPEQLYLGFSRLLYPFFAGLLMAKMSLSLKLSRGFWWTSLFLAITLFVPPIATDGRLSISNGIYEAVAVLLIFPVIVAMGAGSAVTGRSAKVCKFLGEISYPLYLVHQPLVFTLYGPWRATHLEATFGQLMVVVIGMMLLSIFISYAFLKLLDEPVREYLKLKLFKS
jgi:peptidoglycan/LPS O-acetylase OafA/YrhL